MKAFILAAGLGTRLKPLTDNIPKALVKINGTPMLELIIKKLLSEGFDDLIINTHHFADSIIDFLNSKNSFGAKITISDERNKLLDTGGGLKKASWFFSDGNPFLVHNVDIFSDLKLNDFLNFHKANNSAATLAVQNRNSSRYLLFDDQKYLCGWQNVKTGEIKTGRKTSGQTTQFAFSGIHAANPEILNYFPDKDTFSLVDFFLDLSSKKEITYFDHTDSILIDLGKKENLESAEKLIA